MCRAFLTALLLLILSAYVAASPRIAVLPDQIVDLGEFEEKDIQTREVWVKNVGDEPLVILKAFTTCTCTGVKFNPAPIAPGDSATITVVFNGRHRRPGPVRKVFRLTTNADNPVTNVLVKGHIARPFQK